MKNKKLRKAILEIELNLVGLSLWDQECLTLLQIKKARYAILMAMETYKDAFFHPGEEEIRMYVDANEKVLDGLSHALFIKKILKDFSK